MISNSDWEELTLQLIFDSPTIDKTTARRFAKQFRTDAKFRQNARAVWGDRQIYNSGSNDLNAFVFAFSLGGRTNVSAKTKGAGKHRNNI